MSLPANSYAGALTSRSRLSIRRSLRFTPTGQSFHQFAERLQLFRRNRAGLGKVRDERREGSSQLPLDKGADKVLHDVGGRHIGGVAVDAVLLPTAKVALLTQPLHHGQNG